MSKDEIRAGQKDFHGGSYNFTYKDGDNKKNYEYINATNEYFITKNVEEKMTNTGMTAENFFADSKMLLYEGEPSGQSGARLPFGNKRANLQKLPLYGWCASKVLHR